MDDGFTIKIFRYIFFAQLRHHQEDGAILCLSDDALIVRNIYIENFYCVLL